MKTSIALERIVCTAHQLYLTGHRVHKVGEIIVPVDHLKPVYPQWVKDNRGVSNGEAIAICCHINAWCLEGVTPGARHVCPMKTVHALCCARNSIYKTLPAADCWDIDRDVRNFTGTGPVVTHAPCRAWSAFTSHQAKVPPGEKELALLCADHLRRNGGVFESGALPCLQGRRPAAAW